MRIHAHQINEIFILYTEAAQFLINCEHQLSFSPQHNFQIIKKNGRGGWKEGERGQHSHRLEHRAPKLRGG